MSKLEEERSGFQHCFKNVTNMAFADYLVLLSGFWDKIQKNIEISEVFCELTGLKMQGKKWCGFYIQPTKGSW